MPPTDQSSQSKERYFLRLLAALARRAGGELRIKESDLAEVAGAGARQALFEDFDSRRQEIVLRFGSKLSAVYPFDGEGAPAACQAPQPTVQSQVEPSAASNVTPSPASTHPSRRPWTDQQLRDLETKGSRLATAARLRREIQARNAQRQSSNPLDGIL